MVTEGPGPVFDTYEAVFQPFVDNFLLIAVGFFGAWITSYSGQLWIRYSPFYSHLQSKSGTKEQRKKRQKTIDDLSGRTVSIVHDFWTFLGIPYYLGWLSCPAIANPTNFYIESEQIHYIFCVSAGYFLWDMMHSLFLINDTIFVVHAVMSFLAYYCVLFPFAQGPALYYAGVFEFSSIWMHFGEFIRKADEKYNQGPIAKLAETLFDIMFSVSFLFIRTIGGSYVSYTLWVDVLELIDAGKAHSPGMCYLMLAMNVVAMTLQYLWSYVILGLVLTKFVSKNIKLPLPFGQPETTKGSVRSHEGRLID